MRCLVVGGAGFVGSNLVDRLLAEGHRVDVIDDLSTGTLANLAEARSDRTNDLTFHRLDVGDPVVGELLGRRRPEVIFQLALPAGAAVEAEDGSAVASPSAQQRFLLAASASGVSKVVAGIDGHDRYAPARPEDLPLAESNSTRAGSIGAGASSDDRRGALAAAVVSQLEAARAERELEFTVLALASVYGPRQPLGRPIHAGTTACSTDDLLFVDDAVDAIARAAGRGGGLVVNVGTGLATTRTAASRLARDAHLALSWAKPADGQPRRESHFALDPGRAAIQLAWRPWTPLAEGLEATARWLSRDRL